MFSTTIFYCRLLDKQPVTCPHSDSCSEVLQRGNLDDHLRYHCSGTLVACQFAGAGCEYRGPSKSMNKHQNECKFRKEGKKRERKTMRQKEVVSFSLFRIPAAARVLLANKSTVVVWRGMHNAKEAAPIRIS